MRKKPKIYLFHTFFYQCCTCNRWKPTNDFYKDKRTPNGLKAQCKKCHTKTSIISRNPFLKRKRNREYMRKARIKNPKLFMDRERIYSRKRVKNDKVISRNILNNAVKSGKIIRPTICSGCNLESKITAHHNDYSQPLDVEWLCYECHGEKHIKRLP